MKAQSGSRCVVTFFLLTSAVDGGGWLRLHPGRFTPGNKTMYPLYIRANGPQDRSGRVERSRLPPEFNPRTVHPAASRWAIPAHSHAECPTIMRWVYNAMLYALDCQFITYSSSKYSAKCNYQISAGIISVVLIVKHPFSAMFNYFAWAGIWRME